MFSYFPFEVCRFIPVNLDDKKEPATISPPDETLQLAFLLGWKLSPVVFYR